MPVSNPKNGFTVSIEAITLSLDVTPLSVVRFDVAAPLPEWATSHSWMSITRTHNELSLICPTHIIPPGSNAFEVEGCWQALRVEGTLPFHWVGVLACISNVIAQSGISIFVLSTFETDYILVKSTQASQACEALRRAGATVL